MIVIVAVLCIYFFSHVGLNGKSETGQIILTGFTFIEEAISSALNDVRGVFLSGAP